MDSSLKIIIKYTLLLSLFISLQACEETSERPVTRDNYGFEKTKKGYYVTPQKKPEKSNIITVKKGDQLFVLAKKYSVSSRDIIKLNKLKPPYDLLVGQKLILPKSKIHKVKKGESLYGISRKYGVDVTRLVQMNGLKKPYVIKSGEKLLIPYSTYNIAGKNRSSSVKYITRPPKETTAKNVKKNYSKTKKHRKYSSKKSSDNTSKRSPKYFYWPIKGKIISNFGNKTKGISNDGINIVAKEGTPIRSAAKGTVAYIGNKLKSFGNLIIIRHGGGWLTSYAHQKEIYVTKGATVKSGQIIGRVGSTGKVRKSQLYFSIRKGRKAVNPQKMLKNG